MVQESEGRFQMALTTLSGIFQQLPQRCLLLSNDPGAAAVLVRIALKDRSVRRAAAGFRRQAQQVVTAARSLAQRNPGVASLAGAADHAAGLLNGDLDALRAAVEHFRASPRPLARAAAMADAATFERANGSRARAVALLQEGLAQCRPCGANLLISTMERSLLQLDPGRRTSTAQAPPAPPLAKLTSAELRVARLVARGLTNRDIADRLFISRHTVDSHLRHIFEKLRVNSRVELTRIMTLYDDQDQET